MGHIRLGRIPKRKPWTQVFAALSSETVSAEGIASATAKASAERFLAYKRDRSLSYCFWVLVQVATAARGDNFRERLAELGFAFKGDESTSAFVHSVSQRVHVELRSHGAETTFSRIAELALRSVLSEALTGHTGRLFNEGLKDVQSSCRSFSTRDQFGLVARRYFSYVMGQVIQFIADKEVSNHVGARNSIHSATSVLDLHRGIEQYCYDSSKIVEQYSGGWFSKHNWESNNNISETETRKFMAYALEKIHMELQGTDA